MFLVSFASWLVFVSESPQKDPLPFHAFPYKRSFGSERAPTDSRVDRSGRLAGREAGVAPGRPGALGVALLRHLDVWHPMVGFRENFKAL